METKNQKTEVQISDTSLRITKFKKKNFVIIGVFLILIIFIIVGYFYNKSFKNINKAQDIQNQIANNPIISEEEYFLSFWDTFRKAALEKDFSKIAEMTKFPLKTRGVLDSDPIVEFKQEEFIGLFSMFLEQDSGLNENSESELNLISKTKFPDSKSINKNTARVGDMKFVYENNKWWLEFIYLTE